MRLKTKCKESGLNVDKSAGKGENPMIMTEEPTACISARHAKRVKTAQLINVII
jgi:hypothetical protein